MRIIKIGPLPLLALQQIAHFCNLDIINGDPKPWPFPTSPPVPDRSKS